MLPAAQAAYEHRDKIGSAWDNFVSMLHGKKLSIAITGPGGVGKTVLLDHLTGDAFKQGYLPPDQSQKVERGALPALKKRIRLITIPGQVSGPRQEAFKDLMTDEDTVDGIIHVVANGFTTTRSDIARGSLQRDYGANSIEEYRRHQLEAELGDLKETCNFIQASHLRHHRPKWLVVAVAKLDLYYDNLGEARLYYSPFGTSDFSKMLNELRNDVGRSFFRWDAAPVCAWLENFSWNNATVECGLLPAQRDHFVAGFIKKIQSFC